MMKTSKEVKEIADCVLGKYVTKGGGHKKLYEIMESEKIKYRSIKTNASLVGVFTKSNTGQLYIMTNENIANDGRKNFTIAHELGHYFLNHTLIKNDFACNVETIAEEKYLDDTIEREANYFATCFLLPEKKIVSAFKGILRYSKKTCARDFLDVTIDKNYGTWRGICDDLTKRYGVSETALRFRLATLGLARF